MAQDDFLPGSHPSGRLRADWLDIIRAAASKAEEAGHIHNEQLELIYREGWFKLLVPEAYGGAEISLPDLIRLEEAVSWADGSMGWVLTLCTGAGWFGGFLDPALSSKVFAGKKTCLAGSGMPGGQAVAGGNGFILNGQWPYASGAPHATAFTANCVLMQDREPLRDEQGAPLIRSFLFFRDEVRVKDTWQSIGLIATSSDTFEVSGLFVPETRSFDTRNLQIDRPLYRYPFLQLAETTLSVNVSGMAVHFIDLCRENRSGNTGRVPAQKLEKAQHTIRQARERMYEAMEASWQACVESRPLPGELLHRVSSTSKDLARLSLQCVDELYPSCGLSAANPQTELNRVWRDIHTASQHTLLI